MFFRGIYSVDLRNCRGKLIPAAAGGSSAPRSAAIGPSLRGKPYRVLAVGSPVFVAASDCPGKFVYGVESCRNFISPCSLYATPTRLPPFLLIFVCAKVVFPGTGATFCPGETEFGECTFNEINGTSAAPRNQLFNAAEKMLRVVSDCSDRPSGAPGAFELWTVIVGSFLTV